jgi:hypothetical protein
MGPSMRAWRLERFAFLSMRGDGAESAIPIGVSSRTWTKSSQL